LIVLVNWGKLVAQEGLAFFPSEKMPVFLIIMLQFLNTESLKHLISDLMESGSVLEVLRNMLWTKNKKKVKV